MQNVTNLSEYISVIKETIYELEDLRASVEYDEEFMGDALSFVSELEVGVKSLLNQIESGNYQFGEGELPFMEIVNNASDHLLPFKRLFRQIEQIHKQGLD